jgi:uncharacterized membrane protein
METIINKQIQKLIIVFTCCSFSLIILMIRIKITQDFMFVFLVWNLFLAIIPLAIAIGIENSRLLKNNRYLFFLALCVWLLFLPNSFYVITDLLHLKHSSASSIWYDSIMLLSFSISSLLVGYISVFKIQNMLHSFFSKQKTTTIIITVFFLCGFGIYLGRFLRWNSWDILQNPIVLLNDIRIRIMNPIQYIETWGITFGFGSFLLLHFYLFSNINFKTRQNVSI